MGRQKSVATLERELKYAKNKAAYKKPDPEEGGSPRKQPKTAYAYKPMQIADAEAAKKFRVQASKEAVQFFGVEVLNLIEAGAEDPLPRGARPAKVHAMVADGTPKRLKADASKRPYIRYGKGTKGGKSQYTYSAPISIKSANATDTEVKAAFAAVKGKLGGDYGRVWYTPEYFVLTGGG